MSDREMFNNSEMKNKKRTHRVRPREVAARRPKVNSAVVTRCTIRAGLAEHEVESLLDAHAPAAIVFPSGLQAQAVTLVFPPRSLLLTTMTDLLFRLFSRSQMRSVLSDEAVRKSEWFFGCQATAVTAAT